MPRDPLSVWQLEYENVPIDDGTSGPGAWADNLADYIDARISGTSKLEPAPPVFASGASFTWDKATFANLIRSLPPSPEPSSGINAIASAWEASILTSVLIVPSGSFITSPTPPTLWSAPPAASPEPGSISTAKATLISTLLSAPVANTRAQSIFPQAFHTSFGSISFILSGINSVPPPAGPQPLVTTALLF